MKIPTRIAFLGVWLGAAVAQAGTQTAATTSEPAVATGPQVQAEILSVDAPGKAITVRESEASADAKSASAATLPVEGKAIARLGLVKAGDRVTLICAAPATSVTTSTTTTTSTNSPASGADAAAASSSPSTAAEPAAPAAGSSTTAEAASPANPDIASTTAPDTSGAPGGKETASTSSSTSTTTVNAADASSQSGLQATCPSVVEIAKARATAPSPQQ
jgi:ribonuclease E